MCGGSWYQHATIVDTEEERRNKGVSVDTDVVKNRIENKKPEGC